MVSTIDYSDPLVLATCSLASAIKRERETRTDGSHPSNHAEWAQAIDDRLEALALLTMVGVTPSTYLDERAIQAESLPPLLRAGGTY